MYENYSRKVEKRYKEYLKNPGDGGPEAVHANRMGYDGTIEVDGTEQPAFPNSAIEYKQIMEYFKGYYEPGGGGEGKGKFSFVHGDPVFTNILLEIVDREQELPSTPMAPATTMEQELPSTTMEQELPSASFASPLQPPDEEHEQEDSSSGAAAAKCPFQMKENGFLKVG